MIKNNLRVRWAIASILLAGSVGAGTLLAGSGTATAPEAARLTGTAALTTNGQLGPGSYVSSGQSTAILRWPATGGQPSPSQRRPDGTPCTTFWLAPGATTTKTIHNVGSSMLCY
jgi:hypothetical protein